MLSLKRAKAHAQEMANLHGEPWQVFEIPPTAPARQHPGNVFSSGIYHAARVSERAEYEARGARFVGEP